MFLSRRMSLPLPKAVERVVNALTDSVRPLVEVAKGVVKFVLRAVKPYQGLHGFVTAFYQALDGARPVPVELGEATTTVRWVEEIAGAAEAEFAARVARLPRSETVDVLVTGASGALGERLMKTLAEGGKVRAFVRRVPAELPAGVDVALGDLGDPEAVDRAVRGARAVVHVGAAMKGGWDEHERATVVGTRNVVEACRRHGVRKLVHISSMSVNDWAGRDRGVLSESSPYEPRPLDRGHYTRAKLEAEKIVRAAVAEHALPAVILRPGQIFGGRLPLLTPAVARRVGARWLVLGDGRLRLPLVYIDDVVDAIVAALEGPLAHGEIIQLVDPHALTQNEALAVALPGGAKVLRLPRSLVFATGRLSEPILAALGRKSPVSAYRLKSALARVGFVSENAGELLGWQPRVGVVEGIRRAAGGDLPAPAAAPVKDLRPAAEAEPPVRRVDRTA
jgi:2-alkyl-3-oxoalkanoate reductase